MSIISFLSNRENRESPEMTENEIIFSGPGRAGRPHEVSKIFFPNLAKEIPLAGISAPA